MKINLTPSVSCNSCFIKFSSRRLFFLFFFFATVVVFANEIDSISDNISSKNFISLDKIKSKKNHNKSSIIPSKNGRNSASPYSVTSIDLNGPAPGVNNDVLVNAAGTLYFIVNFNNQIITTSGTATSARMTFSSNTNGVPAGVPNPANEVLYVYNAAGTTLLGTYQISTTSATSYDIVVGTNTLRISHATANVFDITEVFGQPILVDNLEIMLRNQYYNHTNPAIGDTRRYAVVSVTDPNNTLSAYARLTTGSDPVAVNDTNAVAANSATAVTGNLLTNDTDATAGDAKTITEVHGYTSSVGAVYTSTYGTITVQSNGAYSYNVDVNNTTLKGLKNGNSVTDIISYQVTDNVGNFDFGYLTVTINGVTEPPVATDNSNNVTVGTSTVATGNVISDDNGLGSDRLDRNTSLFVWESQYTSGAAVNGTTRTVGGVNVSFVKDVPSSVETATNQTVDFGTNGGHTGYLLFGSNPAVNPAADNKLTINFSKPVTNISFALSDIDFVQTNSWQDQMRVLGSLAGANVNYNKQVAGSILQTGSDTFYGTGSVPSTDAHGNVTISFNSPIDKLEFYYNYGPNVTAPDPGGQIAGLTDLLWQDDEASGVLRVNGLTTNVGVPVAGAYGTFIIYANGSYTYTLNSSNAAVLALTSGQTLTDSIPYSISDNIPGSGNIANANLIITITCTPPVAPTVTTSAATCASPGTATITNYDSSFTYTFSPAGPNVGAGGVISSLTPNTSYTVTATVGAGGCASNASSAFSVSPSQTPSAPVVGAITQPTCSTATGSVVLSGLPSSGTWTVTASPGGATVTSTGITTTFSGLTAGTTYTFTVTNASSCTSSSSTNAIIFNRLCANNDSFVNAGGSVIQNDFINGVVVTTTNTDVTPVTNGPLSIDANGNLTIVSGTTPGSYAITYTICETANSLNCTTATVTVTIIDNDSDGVYDSSDLDDDNDGVLDTEELRCDYNPSVYNFVSGNGATRNQLLIFDWTGASLTNVNDTFTTLKVVNGITYTARATVVALVGGYNTPAQSPTPSVLNTFPGGGNQMFWRYANYGSTAADDLRGALVFQLARVVGNKLSIKFDITATKGGLAQEFDAVAFDAESTTGAEKGLYTTNSSNWTLIDNIGAAPLATEASIVGNELRYDDTQSTQRSLFAYTRGVNVSILGEYSNETNLARTQAMGVGVYLYCDSDNDGAFNYLDLDSDNDGCSDSNEYYNNATRAASGQQFGQTGGAVAPVNANGTVNLPAATYTGSYTGVTNNAVSACNAPVVTIEDATIAEGGNLSFPVTLSNPSATDITLTLGFTNISTTNGDYTTTAVTVTFLAGATTATATVPSTADTIDENNETFTIAITSATGTVGSTTDTATGTIEDNDNAPVVTIEDATIAEGGNLSFPVTLSNPSATDITLTLGFTNISTTNGDYTTTAVTVTFLAGATTATATVPSTADTIDENNETFTIAITSATGTVGSTTDTATGTIEDNDNAPVVTIEDATIAEGGNLSFPVTLSNPSATDITLTLGFTNISTTNGDYTTTAVTVTFLAGATTATATVPSTADTIDENNETFTIAITSATGTVGSTTDTATGTIEDNDNAPVVTIEDATIAEGGNLSFPVTLSNPSATDITLTLGFTNISTTNGDYTTTSVTVTFLAGATTATATVPSTADTIDENNETFTIAITSATGTVGSTTDTATGTIEDNDNAPVVTIEDATIAEGGNLSFPVTLSNPSATDITLTLGFTNISTTNGDYTTTSVTVTFLAGATTATATVPSTADTIDENNETFTIAITSATGTVGSTTDTATGTIEDNDNAPVVTIEDATIAEGGNLSFPVTLSNPSATDITLTLGFTNISTTNGDYTTTPVTVTFLAGATTATATVPSTADTIDENNETFTIAITSATGTVGSTTDTATGTIEDNDNAPVVTIEDATIAEGGNLSFPVTLSNPSATDITLTLGFTNISTTNGDYTTTAVTVTFLAGATTATATVPSTADTIDENNETFTIAITSATGTVGSTTDTATGTIEDNDNAPVVTIEDATIAEGGNLSFPVTLSNPSATDITLTLGFTNISTTNGDYTTTAVTVTFLAGATTATATVPSTADTIDENNETFTIAITSATGTVGSTTDTATGTIEDNDNAPVVTIEDATIAEGGNLSFPVTLSNPSATDITLTLGFTNISTTNGDYTTTAVTVTFLAGATTATATVPSTADTIDENNETFTIAITSATGTVGATTDTATGTIEDNDNAPVVTIEDATIAEGGNLSFPVTLSNPSATDITLTLGFTNISTTNGDYTTTAVTVTFLAGATTATATVPSTADTIDENNETFTIAITSATGTVGSTTDTATGTIEDNDNAPVVTIEDATIAEGGNLSFPVTLSNPSATDITLTLGFTNISTTNGDYTTTAVTVTFLAGATTATATVPSTADTIDENNETFTIAITSATGTVGATTDTATGTIEDNDNAPVVTIEDATIAEGGNLSFPVTLSNPSATDITLTLGFTNISTTNGDYTTTAVTVTFLAGATTATATVPSTADTIDENNETFTIAITSATGTVGSTTDTATGTIEDNDNAPVVTIEDATIAEGGNLSFPVTLSNPSATDITLTLGFTNISTTNGDYTTTAVTVTFLAGATTATATVPSTADTIDENNETFTIAITSATGTVGSTTDTATGTIEDNDNAPVVTIEDATIAEGGNLSFPVTLSNPSATDITLTLGFTNISTTNGDYTTTAVTVTFLAGATTATATVPSTADTIDENNETFTIAITSATGTVGATTDTATGTIEDNDNAPVVTIEDATIAEGGNLSFPVTLSNPSATDITLTLGFTNISTTNGDYTTTPVTVTFLAGATTATATVPSTADTIDENNETFTIAITSATGTVGSTTDTATGTIEDNDNAPVVTIEDATIAEGGNLSFPVTLSNPSATDITLTLGFTNISTTNGDYTTTSVTVTFLAGATTATATVPSTADTIDENNETFTIAITSATGTVGSTTDTATGTIEDNDNAPVVTIEDATIAEGGNLSFPVTLSNPSATDITLTLGFTNISTTNGDYTTTSVTVTFLAGATTATATVPSTADTIDENNETFTIAITSATGTVGSTTDTATGTIEDNDNAPVVTIEDATIAEGGNLSFPVTLSNPSATDITLTLGFTNISTTNGDYTTTSVTVTFLAGATTATATVPSTADTIDENNETFTIAITSATGTVGSTTDTATGTIEDNDNAPVVTIEDATIAEGGNLSFPVTLSNPSATDITLTLGFTNISTTNGDYTTTSVTVTFLAGATTATATVPSTADTIDENNETFTIAITSATGTVGSTTDTATGTIEDNDNAPVVTIEDATIAEGGNLSFPVTLSNPSATDITLTLGFTNISTTNGDYTTTSVTVTFLAGATTATATVPSTADTIDENNETFTIAITSATGTVGSTTDTATGTIEDNDNAPVVTIEDATIAEGGNLSFPVTLSNPSATDITLTLGFTNISTTNGDYTTTSVTVTFLAGATTATATVPSTADTIDENNETFTIAITSATGTVGSTTDTATGTIEDNDNAPVVTIEDATIAEGGNLSFPVTLSNPSATDITLTLGFTNISTTNGDYTTTSVTVTFLAGATTATATVPSTADTIDENNETFTIAITSATGTVGSTTDTATGTIEDNDNAPVVTIEDATIAEGGNLSFPVTLSNPSATDITLTLGFTNISTTNGDYTTTAVTVTFLAGATTATATVPSTADTIDENNETFTIAITSATGTVGSTTDTATGTIEDNDNAPVVTIEDATIAEGGNLSFPVTLSNPSATDITLTLGFTNISTTNGDYTTTAVTVTFLAGATTATATVPSTADTIDENNETFTIAITSATGTVGSTTDTATGTIEDNDNAPVVTIEDATIAEGGNLSFPVTLSNPSATDITLTLGFTNISTTNGDYTTTPVTVTFLAGATTATATVPSTADTIDENNETFTIAITSATGTVGSTTDTATGTIEDNDNAPVVTIEDATIAEGGNLSFPVTLSNPSATDITLTLGFTNISTTNGDYTTTPVTVTFLAGATTATATVPSTADTIDENNETFTIAITSATGTVGSTTDTATGTIEDNDNAPVVTIEDATIAEGGNLSFPVTLSNPSATDITLTLGFTNISTTNGDYTTTPVTVTFLAGATTATATVPSTADTIDENNETFTIAITSATGTVGSTTDTATGTIEDNDNAPVVTIEDATIAEGGNLSFPVTLSNPSATDITLTLGFTNISTTNGDYTTTPVTVTFLAGATTATATVPSTADTIDENNEIFTIAITSATGTVGSTTDTATGTIEDNDNAPVVTIEDATIAEGGNLSFPVTLSNPSATDITLTLGFTNISTTNGDYTTTPVTVTFLAGATTATATVPSTADTIDENNETFTIAITSATGTVGSTTDTATGTIEDNDNAPVVTIEDATIAEGGNLSFPVTLSNPSATDITLTLGFTNISTTNGDYTTTPVTVTFLAGATTATATVPSTADTIDENNETFTIAITSATGTVGSTTDTATGTIEDNDNAPVVTIEDATIAEGGNLSFPVTLSNPSATDITLTLGFTNISTTNGDYTTTPVTVTFLAGATTATATVPSTADTIDENNEIFTIAITSATGTVGSTTDTATGTIEDNDNAPTVESISAADAIEGDAVVFNFILSNPSAVDTSYTFTLTNGTAGSADYTTTDVTVLVPAGATSGTVAVPTSGDSIDEANETFTINNGSVSATGTITDNDNAPTVASISAADAIEGDAVVFNFILSNPSAVDTSYTFTLTNGTAGSADYTTTDVTVLVPAGATSGTVAVPTSGDSIDEANETFTINNGSVSATGTITDNDNAPTVASISAADAIEGDAVVFNFTLSNPSAVDTSYTFTLTNGTAGSADYTTTDVTVLVPAGATSGTVAVPTSGDSIDEANETFTINNGSVSATGTITDNDNAPTVASISAADAIEGDAVVFNFILSNPSAVDTSYTFTLTNGTAGSADYTTTDVTVLVPAGATSGTVAVPTSGDSIDEANETFTINNGSVSATGTITDNDNAPTVASISAADAIEGDAVVFNFILSNPSAVDTSYTFTLTNGTAGSADYTTTDVTVLVPAGATSGTVAVPTSGDSIDEANETFTINNGSVSATGTITDNDNAPTVASISAADAIEGDAVVFNFILSNPSAVDTSYTFTLTNGTAGSADYTTTDVTVLVPAGATSGTVAVPTSGDSIDEANETFTINNGSVSATGTITDNDNAPTVASISAADAIEGDAVVFNFTLSNPSAVDTSYTFTLTNGTAGSADYTTTDVTVLVPAGATSGTVAVPTSGDSIDEANETFTINNGSVSATGTITDNDNAPTVASISAADAIEGDAVVFNFTLSNPSAVDTSYTFTLTNGTAGSADYTTTDVTVLVPAGATSGTVAVPTSGDSIDEANETFTINNGSVSATGTITDNDNAPTVASISAADAIEGDAVVFNFILSNPSAVDTSYTFTLTNGTAGSADYTTTDVTVLVPAGATSGTVAVPTSGDSIDEANETFTINNGSVSATGTITDNDNAPTVASISAADAIEGDAVVFNFILSNPSAVDTSYTFTLTNGTAGSADYTTTDVTVLVPAGATSGTVAVPTSGDSIDEANETFTINNGSVSATGTITDNDNAPTVASISAADAIEGDAVVFNFTLSNPSAVDTSYTFTLTNGTAGSADYTTTDVTVLVPAGATSGTVAVPTSGDSIDEANEIFTINNGSVSATGTITDNDVTPVATNDTTITDEDIPVMINVTTNDTDFDGFIDVITVDLDPATTGIQTTFTVAGEGTYTVDNAGVVTFTPVLNFNGTATPITYTVNDNNGLVSNSATLTITVTAVTDALVANNDTIPSTGGNVTANDVLNGVQVTTANTDVTPVTNGPLSIDADGNLTVAPNTASGTYTITYQICEVGVIPVNCQTATVMVNYVNPLVASNDTFSSTGGNVLGNDSVNGTTATVTNIVVTPVSAGSLTIDGEGNLTVAPNTPSGTYTIVYEICQTGMTPANCTTATVTVVVNNLIVANNNTFPSTGGNVIANDMINGGPATAANTDVTPVTNGPLSIDADGNLTVAPNTPSGTYNVEYEICEVGATPANCTRAIATVVINNRIAANNVTIPSTGGNVTVNDTINGAPATAANTDVTPVTNGPLRIDADGNLTVATNTPSGTYTIVYQICEVGAIPINCEQATATVVVNNALVANNDTIPATGGNVLANDTINGAPATAANTDVTPVTNGPLSIDANGNLTVAPNSVAGTYTITYQVCETGSNPLICTMATVTVVVNETPQIAIVKTAVFNDENSDGFAQAGETITYSFTISNLGNTPLSNVTVTDVLPGLILSGNSISLLPVGSTNNTAYQGVYRLTQADINLGSVTNQATATGVTPLGVVVSDLSDDSNTLSDRPTVLAIQGCVIKVFNAVAPNGSGDNKVFRIRGLECYSDNKVEIYNRWGVLVFERTAYNNDDRAFRGVSEGRVTIKQYEELPEGTYYYILRYKDSTTTSFEKAGYLYINR